MGKNSFLFIALVLFCVLSVLVISGFISFIKNNKGDMSRKPINKYRKRVLVFLLIATYSSLMLFAVFTELEAGANFSDAILSGIKICFANTVRPPFSLILIMLLCILTQGKKKRGTEDSSLSQDYGTGDGSPSHEENSK